jgi:rubredoxin
MDRLSLCLTNVWILTMISDKSTNDDSITDMMTSQNSQTYKNKIEKKAVKYYSCKACGNTFDANPPDDVHKFSSVYQCWKFDWIEREYRCPGCSKTTTLYWHSEVHKYRDYATSEEVTLKKINGKLDDDSSIKKRMAGY